MAIRFDKYCWNVRLCKTRSHATELISKGKIKLNQQQVKPSKEVKKNDFITIQKNTAEFSYQVIDLIEKRVGAKLVSLYLNDTTPLQEVEKYKTYQLAQANYREYGTGKPSKKDRRDLDEFLEW